MRKTLTLLVAMATIPAALAAQDSGKKNVITVQPLNAIFEVYSAEYERAIGEATTLGVGANFWNNGNQSDQVQYLSSEVKLRYYPAGKALHDFSVGATLGVTSLRGQSTTTAQDETVSGLSYGVLLEYQWLLGKTNDFAVACGVGAKVLSIGQTDFNSNVDLRYPTGRVSIGFRF